MGLIGTWPAQMGRARSSTSSAGPPTRILAEASSMGIRNTAVWRSSGSFGGRASSHRPGVMWSTMARRPRSLSSPSTGDAVPTITTER